VSLFTLLLQYIGDTPAQQHTAFLKVRLVQGPCPLGWFRSPIRSGLGFLWFMKGKKVMAVPSTLHESVH
jgi:hypothetical protein